jgi:hypothetical protein
MISINKMLGFSYARRSTRRWIVAAYWCAMTLGCAGFQRQYTSHGINSICIGLVFNFIVCTGLLGGVRGGGPVRAFRGVRWIPWATEWKDYQFQDPLPQSLTQMATSEPSDVYTPLDERETWERDRMHFIAYTLVRWLTLLLFALYILFGAIHAEWLRVVGPLILFLITLTLWSLPQSLILWTEPDMEAEG